MKHEINVGLIGYGYSGSIFHAPVIRSVEGLKIKKVVSSQPKKVQGDLPDVEVIAEVGELLSDPEIDLVVITAPNSLHYSLTKQSLRTGKHVVVEKPFVIHSKEAKELMSLAKERNLLLSVYQNRRWDNDYLTVKKCIEDNLLGEIVTYEAHFDRYIPKVTKKWREQKLEGSGVLYDLGPHLIDQAIQLFGLPRTIWADVGVQRPGAIIDDYFHIVLNYEGPLRVILHSGSMVCQPGPRFLVHGTEGSFIKYGKDPQATLLEQGQNPQNANWGEDPPDLYGELITYRENQTIKTKMKTIPGNYRRFYSAMYEAITRGTAVPVDPADAMNVIKVIEKAQESNQGKKLVALAPKSSEKTSRGSGTGLQTS